MDLLLNILASAIKAQTMSLASTMVTINAWVAWLDNGSVAAFFPAHGIAAGTAGRKVLACDFFSAICQRICLQVEEEVLEGWGMVRRAAALAGTAPAALDEEGIVYSRAIVRLVHWCSS